MPVDNNPFPYRNFLHPKYWPTWLGLGLLWLCSRLPYSWNLALGNTLGLLGFYLMPGRRRITRTNIRLCFPELDKKATRQRLKQNFQSSTLALFESAMGWWAAESRMQQLYRVEGLENLREAEALGKGVLLIGGHYTTLEISGRFLGYLTADVHPTYKPAHNPLFEAVMAYSRRKIHAGLIASRDMRTILKTLKNNKTVWYAPDQDFGMTSTVFAPFMGIDTATLTLTARIAKKSGASVLPYYSERLANNQGYLIRFGPILENFPTGDDVVDATTINEVIERGVRSAPEQYLWGHRRFKTRPRGEPQLYAIRRNKYMRRYSLLHTVLAIPIIFYTIWQAYRCRDRRYLLQRLGLQQPVINAPVWLHAASVGEVNAIVPLIKLIHSRDPAVNLLLTTNTPSGQITAQDKIGDIAHCYYLPVDWKWSVKRFIEATKPACALITETELWPNLYEYCFYTGVRIIIINGRLSSRSIKAPFTIRYWLSQAVHYTFAILTRSEEDTENFIKLGAKQEHVKTIGNIKYTEGNNTQTQPIQLGRSFVVAASTRDNEEKQLVTNWKNIPGNKPLLVIVPRHPKRLQKIVNDISPLSSEMAIRSKGDVVSENTEIYIADTFGELNQFMAASEFVIMGGSFRPFGGQNILEASREGKAVIFGPYMDNFKQEAQHLLAHNAAIQVINDKDIESALQKLLSQRDYREQLGKNGQQSLEAFSNIAETYLKEIVSLCPSLSDNQSP